MESKAIMGFISAIREKVNTYVLQELKRDGIDGFAPTHGTILGVLYRHKTMTMSDLATSIKRNKSTTTTLVKKLITLGYITKSKDLNDGRSYLISLTEKGILFQPIFIDISNRLETKLFQDFSESEKDMLFFLLDKLLQNC